MNKLEFYSAVSALFEMTEPQTEAETETALDDLGKHSAKLKELARAHVNTAAALHAYCEELLK